MKAKITWLFLLVKQSNQLTPLCNGTDLNGGKYYKLFFGGTEFYEASTAAACVSQCVAAG